MTGSTFQPPTHLDPNQDSSQQVAFINQNFQSLAATLETNSFRIVNKDTVGVPIVNGTIQQTTITHNLGYIPVILAFLALGTNNWAPLPYTPFASGATNISSNLSIAIFNITSTTFQIWTMAGNPGNNTFNITYYILQETVN